MRITHDTLAGSTHPRERCSALTLMFLLAERPGREDWRHLSLWRCHDWQILVHEGGNLQIVKVLTASGTWHFSVCCLGYGKYQTESCVFNTPGADILNKITSFYASATSKLCPILHFWICSSLPNQVFTALHRCQLMPNLLPDSVRTTVSLSMPLFLMHFWNVHIYSSLKWLLWL